MFLATMTVNQVSMYEKKILTTIRRRDSLTCFHKALSTTVFKNHTRWVPEHVFSSKPIFFFLNPLQSHMERFYCVNLIDQMYRDVNRKRHNFNKKFIFNFKPSVKPVSQGGIG